MQFIGLNIKSNFVSIVTWPVFVAERARMVNDFDDFYQISSI